jgi:predicted helicase
VNLHGSAQKNEVTPDGSKDENIFDIMQGVTLFIGVKTSLKQSWGKIYYADLWGTRENKFKHLAENVVEFIELVPDPKMAYFIPFGGVEQNVYEKGIRATELFTTTVTGLNTGNDNAAVSPTKEELKRRIEIVKNAIDENTVLSIFRKFCANQTATKIQNDLLTSNGVISTLSYRPFDSRWSFYSGNSGGWMDRPRDKKVMGHLLCPPTTPIGQNIGLVFPKGTNKFWDGAFISNSIIDAHYIDYPGRSYSYIAPLYLYNDSDFGDEWMPNFTPDILERLTENITVKPTPIEVFDYIYGILYDPVYRERFNEFLKRDFPRVPINKLRS